MLCNPSGRPKQDNQVRDLDRQRDTNEAMPFGDKHNGEACPHGQADTRFDDG